MIVGSVNEDGIPTVSLTVAGQTRTGVVDTGFNGDLELPDQLRPVVNARFFGASLSHLAGNRTIEEDAFIVDLSIRRTTYHRRGDLVSGS